MKRIFLIIAALAISHAVGFSQGCLSEGITFSNQNQIDNFQTNYPGCSEIEGDVTISGEDITNLDGLNVLVSIGGNLQIRLNTILGELSGLHNLNYLGGDLRIEQNNLLVNLQGLENLSNLNGDLIIGDVMPGQYPYSTGNPSLTSLTGLNNLVSIQGSLKLCGNYSLTSLSGLENLALIGGYLQVGSLDIFYGFTFGNPLLVNLSGLTGLSAVGGGLFIAGNTGLANLSGLDSLISVGQNCWFDLNESLVTLQGLNQLTSIGGSLNIRWNIALSDISALGNMAAQSIQDLEIIYNQALAECSILSICGYLAAPNGSMEISGNAPGCDSPEEVEEGCEGLSVPVIPQIQYMSISPNPANAFMTILSPSIVSLTILSIFNLTGQQVMERQINYPETRIDISALPAGIHFVRLQNETMFEIRKLIKN
jgi:hypothetical protein